MRSLPVAESVEMQPKYLLLNTVVQELVGRVTQGLANP
jgi:hypothetical protein